MAKSTSEAERSLCERLLGIAGDQYPPDYFQLLGLERGCADEARIARAAERRAARLRQGVATEFQPAARQLLQRVAQARTCLLDPRARQAYLERIAPSGGKRTAPASPQGAAEALALDPLPDLKWDLGELLSAEQQPLAPLAPLTPRGKRSAVSVDWARLGLCAGGLLGLLLVGGLLAASLGGSAPENLPEEAAAPASSVLPPARPDVQPVVESAAAAPSATADSSVVAAETRGNVPADSLAQLGDDRRFDGLDDERLTDASAPGPLSDAASVARFAELEQPPLAAEAAGSPVVPPPLPRAAGALRDLPAAVDLPVRAPASAVESAADLTVELGQVDPALAAQLEVALCEPTVRKYPSTQFVVAPAADAGDVRTWPIKIVAASSAPAPDTREPAVPTGANGTSLGAPKSSAAQTAAELAALEPFEELVATLSADRGRLALRWERPQRRNFAGQLRNCLLVLTAGGESHTLQLRSPQQAPVFVTDLSERQHLWEIAGEDMPALDALQLQFRRIDLRGANFAAEPSADVLPHGETLRLVLQDWDRPVELLFAFLGDAETPKIRFSARYRLSTRWTPLTSIDLGDAIAGLEDARADGAARLAAARSAAASLPGQISSNAARMNSNNGAEVRAVENRLRRQLNSAQGTIRRMERSLPDIDQNVVRLRALADVARRFHQQGQVEFRVVVASAQGEVVLFAAEGPPPPAS